MINCTIADNYAVIGNGVDFVSGHTRFQTFNCISDSGIAGMPSIHTIYPFEVNGPGNLVGDPLFIDPENRDYRIQVGSPCIDAGTDVAVARDLDAFPRPVDVLGMGRDGPGAYDIGAYEFQLSPADLNSDGHVNGADLLLFQGQWHEEIK